MMRVLYSIEPLWLGCLRAADRTGIFRVAKTLAENLLASSACELSFHRPALLDFDEAQFRAYLPELSAVPVIPHSSPGGRWRRTLGARVESIRRRSYQGSLGKLASLARPYVQRLREKLAPVSGRQLEGYDIFHSPFEAFPLASREVAGLHRFLTVHDLTPVLHSQYHDATSYFVPILDCLSPRDWVICISNNTKNDLCAYLPRIDPARVFVIPPAASPEVFHPRAEASASVRSRYGIPDGPYLLSLNTLEPRKNLDHAIRCFARLVSESKIKDLSYVLCGPRGWKTEQIFSAVGQAGLNDRIVLTGFVAEEDLAPLYSGALAFVYPSHYEGFGLPPLEAMQCGAPVITTNTSSLPEVVGNAALTLDPTDADGLCQSMLDVYSRPSLRQDLSARSLDRARQFSWQRCLQETLAAYRMALDSQ